MFSKYTQTLLYFLVNDVGRGAHNFLQVKAAFYSAYTKLNQIIKNDRLPKSGEPMLQSIMTFPQSFVQFRRRINCLPFENILEHIGNEPFIFGGQPSQPFSYDCDAREAILFPATINASPQIFFPQSMHQQQNQQQQQQSSTFDENGISIEQLSTSSSEASSSATPTAFPSPHSVADNNISIPRVENEFYTSIQQPQMQQQQIFFPPPPPQIFHHQNQRPEMFSFNPYFAMSFPQHFQHQIPPPHAYHHQHFINSNDYTNNNNNQQQQEYAYSESYYNGNEEEELQQQQNILEDDFGKMLSLDDDETKANNGNISDASSDSSGLSSGSADSMISCSTVTPESCDEQIIITTATEGEEEESSSNGESCCNKNGRS
jgi:hypothetical protein